MSEEVIKAGAALDIPLDKIEDCYVGEFDSDEDLAYGYLDNTELLAGVSETIRYYFDIKR